jgi:hypothetical protein
MARSARRSGLILGACVGTTRRPFAPLGVPILGQGCSERRSHHSTGFHVRLLLGAFLAFLVAAGTGLGATWLALTRGTAFSAITIGAWTAWPKTGTTDIDPYARASIARSGELPIGSGDGIAFYARADDAGNLLDGRCETLLRGVTPAARFWTLTLYDPEGRVVANSANRYGFTSQAITRFSDGSFQIVVAPRARPGNWLPSGGADRYLLVLRLYDTPVGAATRIGREAPMPAISRRACP